MGSIPASGLPPLAAPAGAVSAAQPGPRLLPAARAALGAASRSPQFPKPLPSHPGGLEEGTTPSGEGVHGKGGRGVGWGWWQGKANMDGADNVFGKKSICGKDRQGEEEL